LSDLQATLNQADADFILSATPVDLGKLLKLGKPVIRVRYEYADAGTPGLAEIVEEFLAGKVR
jgi:predicted GTPase